MADEQKGILGSGAALVLRHQRVLWGVFAVNLLLGALGAYAAAGKRLSDALSHSLAGQQLSKGFDVGMLIELSSQPEVRLFRGIGTSFVFAGLFLLFMLFVTGGILSVYLRDRKLTSAEFFGASGAYFWPMVRLALWSLIPFVAINFLYEGVSKLSDKVGDQAVDARTGFLILVLGCIPVLLLLVWVRMWFDLAQVRAVGLENRTMRRNAVLALTLARKASLPLFWNYIGIGVLAWIVTAICLVIWAKLPPTAIPGTFLLLEIIMLAHIGTRLWQKACATTWYQRNTEPVSAPWEPFTPTVPQYSEVVDVDRPLSPEIEPVPPGPAGE